MPVFRSGPGQAPSWCELERFEIVRLDPGESRAFGRVGTHVGANVVAKQKLVVAAGECRVSVAGDVVKAGTGAVLELSAPDGRFEIHEALSRTIVVHLTGRWQDPVGNTGLFQLEHTDDPNDAGDPVDYPESTNLDSHFHDCDEYWIVYEGRGVAVTEGKSYEVGPGDCVAIGMHHHHDLPQVFEPAKAVYFETTPEGEMRGGHLWEHTHGPAHPRMDRV